MAEAAKADIFVWEGTDKSGKKVKGEMPGKSHALVRAMLRKQGVKPLKVKKKPKDLFGGASKGKITPKVLRVPSAKIMA